MIMYEISIVFEGIFWLCGIEYYIAATPWYWLIIAMLLKMIAVSSLLFLFWNLAYMYWLSSK